MALWIHSMCIAGIPSGFIVPKFETSALRKSLVPGKRKINLFVCALGSDVQCPWLTSDIVERVAFFQHAIHMNGSQPLQLDVIKTRIQEYVLLFCATSTQRTFPVL